ncbi:hypothetical protein BHYA_0008g00570 [Botrytis hyacinthi]|uniref:Uncharacterized protein n=1 Tax=Botrytis hyacinthi TaxID=278943 RepID=A0A4Z1H026_9HELO|nr:hypothetical protein BHYA_0008g00570 [Botrytis hyacinthi]
MSKNKSQLMNSFVSEHVRATHSMSDLQADHDLWYKIRVLIHDLHNIANDHATQARTQNTTDELYVSGPYFTLGEAARIKGTIVPSPILTEIPEFEELEFEGDLEHYLFFEKRKASGDARPCGPYDMGPIYRATFMVSREELKDEKFLGRLRRAGLSEPRTNVTGNVGNNKKMKNGRR